MRFVTKMMIRPIGVVVAEMAVEILMTVIYMCVRVCACACLSVCCMDTVRVSTFAGRHEDIHTHTAVDVNIATRTRHGWKM